MDLFKNFTRGQENAQDQLNANFAALEGAAIVDSESNSNGTLWDTGLLHYSANKGNLTSGAFWTNLDNFPRGMSYTLITDTTGYTNAPFANASYIVMGNGYVFSVLAMQSNGTGIKYITGISSSTDLSWQTVK